MNAKDIAEADFCSKRLGGTIHLGSWVIWIPLNMELVRIAWSMLAVVLGWKVSSRKEMLWAITRVHGSSFDITAEG
jgi:hypothetical protein